MSKFLDMTGFTYFWNKLKTRLDDIESRIGSGSGTSEPPYVIGSFNTGEVVQSESYLDKTITFDSPLSFTPSSIIFTEDMRSTTRIALFNYAVLSLSSTGFKVRIFNPYKSGANTRDVIYTILK